MLFSDATQAMQEEFGSAEIPQEVYIRGILKPLFQQLQAFTKGGRLPHMTVQDRCANNIHIHLEADDAYVDSFWVFPEFTNFSTDGALPHSWVVYVQKKQSYGARLGEVPHSNEPIQVAVGIVEKIMSWKKDVILKTVHLSSNATLSEITAELQRIIRYITRHQYPVIISQGKVTVQNAKALWSYDPAGGTLINPRGKKLSVSSPKEALANILGDIIRRERFPLPI